MSTKGGTNRPGGRSKPARYSGARLYGTTGGYTKALEWHSRGPAEDAPSTGKAGRRVRRAPTGGQCQGTRLYGKVEGLCGLPEGHINHRDWTNGGLRERPEWLTLDYHPFKGAPDA